MVSSLTSCPPPSRWGGEGGGEGGEDGGYSLEFLSAKLQLRLTTCTS